MSVEGPFGFNKGDIVQEFGYDDDVDFDVRDAIEAVTGEELEDEDYRGAADGVLAWWRSDDGDIDDLTDYLVDCAASLADGSALLWLAVPGRKSDLHVPTTEVGEAAKTAGLSVTRTHGLESGWTAFRITPTKSL